MQNDSKTMNVIGAGLAGCEASYQLAEAGFQVTLYEQKPAARTPAQVSDHFAELVCSNSLRSANPSNAVGLLKEEMARMGSLVIRTAQQCRVPAGDALAVEREAFGRAMDAQMHEHPRIVVRHERVDALPPASMGPTIIATGPLTADALAQSLAQVTGQESLYFYDAIAPILAADAIDRSIVFEASRWDKGDGADYLNCPLNQDEYEALIDYLLTAETYPSHAFEAPKYFPGCQPIEVIAATGREALRFGPLKPVGLTDPRTGRWPHAVVQLRKEDPAGQAYNLVGLQTKLRHGAQRGLLQRIPGLGEAEVLRFGALHRNTYVDAPNHLDETLRLRALPHVRLAGQITGVEGYVESAACGLLVALLVQQAQAGQTLCPPPPNTALGALYRHVRGTCRVAGRPHEPQNVHWGLFAPAHAEGPDAPKRRDKRAHKTLRVEQARRAFAAWLPLARSHNDVTPMQHDDSDASLRELAG